MPAPWKFVIDGQTYREAELTINDYEKLEEQLKVGWLSINPALSAKQAKTIAGYMVSQRTGMPMPEALDKIGVLSSTDFIDDFEYEVDEPADPPEAAATPSS